MNDAPPAIVQFLGHLHPMFVHLPIGFLVLLAVLEAAAWFKPFRHLTGSSRAILVCSLPVAAASVLCGWFLSWGGDYDAQLLFWHQWLGTGVGVAALLLLLLHWRGWLKTYRAALFASLVLITVAGHFGAALTHGSNYISFAMFSPKSRDQAPDPETQSFYAAAVQPVLKQYCVGCHGSEKSKGKLRLDTPEHILKGGDSGDVIVAGNAAQSLLIKRLHLPAEEDEHMPPHAKPQPSASDIALLEWWVNSGAATDKTLRDLNPPAHILQIIQSKAGLSR